MNQNQSKPADSEQGSGEGLSSSVLLSLLRSLLEGLECREIDQLITDACPEKMKALGAEVTKSAKLGAAFYRRGMGDPILCDNSQADAPGGQRPA